MRSQICFFMHPDDEGAILEFIRGLPNVRVDLRGRRVAYLHGSHSLSEDKGSVQFSRSLLEREILTEGRFALATSGFSLEETLPEHLVLESEELFKKLRRFIKSRYRNGVVHWWNPTLPKSPTNPGKPDRSVWLGPEALRWWNSAPDHKLKQHATYLTEAARIPEA